MERRAFLAGSAALLAAPLAAEAQQAGKVYRIGVFSPQQLSLETFREGLRDHGYVEGQNIVIEHRTPSALKEHPALIADLVGRKVDIIVTWSTPALAAAYHGDRRTLADQ